MKNLDVGLVAVILFAASAMSAIAADPPAGRILGSQCFQCHGTNGQSKSEIESISGESASDLYETLREMKAKNGLSVMNQQAKVYSDAELRLIADYLSTLRRVDSPASKQRRRR